MIRYRGSHWLQATLFIGLSMIVAIGDLMVPTIYAISASDLNRLNMDTPFYDPASQQCDTTSGGTTTTSLAGNDNQDKTFNYLISKGLGIVPTAAIMGNLMEESGGIDPEAAQNRGDFPHMPQDSGFRGKLGYGIAQWTDYGRQQGLLDLASKDGKIESDLGVQLDYFWSEASGPYVDVLNQIRPLTSPSQIGEATKDWMLGYEKPDLSVAHLDDQRIPYAEQVYAKHINDPGVSGSTSCGSSNFLTNFIQYKQCPDSSVGATAPWANNIYDNPDSDDGPQEDFTPPNKGEGPSIGTVCSAGCGPSAIAMIISNLEQSKVTPDMVASFGVANGTSVDGGGTIWTLPDLAAKHWGLKIQEIGETNLSDNSIPIINNALRAGSLILFTSDGAPWPATPFSPEGHFLVIRAVNASQQWLVGTSMVGLNAQGWDKGNLMSHPWDPVGIINASTHHNAWIFSKI